MREPAVSVVVPSCRRPRLAIRAIRSALAQSFDDLEVVVVPACPGDGLPHELETIDDPRLRVLEPKRLEESGARNYGILNARGAWIAHLDDDDEWMPGKLERQLAVAEASSQDRPVISCRMLARSRDGDFVWPRRLPEPGEPMGDYLFRRRSLFGGGGFAQSSTLLAPRSLALEVPFQEGLRIAVDLDWVLRAEQAGSRVEFAGTEPLTIWDLGDDRHRQSSAQGVWREAVAWIERSRDLVSPEAYASYLLTWVSADAAREGGGWRAWRSLWSQARQGGSPSTLDAIVHSGHFLVSSRALRKLALLATGRGKPGFR